MNKTEIIEAIASAMALWDRIIDAARQLFPNASEDEIYEIASSKMNSVLNLE